jgi:hypothetical protein
MVPALPITRERVLDLPVGLCGELSLQRLHLDPARRLQPGRLRNVLFNVGGHGEGTAQLLYLSGPKLRFSIL